MPAGHRLHVRIPRLAAIRAASRAYCSVRSHDADYQVCEELPDFSDVPDEVDSFSTTTVGDPASNETQGH